MKIYCLDQIWSDFYEFGQNLAYINKKKKCFDGCMPLVSAPALLVRQAGA
jgi:hypothetical protein